MPIDDDDEWKVFVVKWSLVTAVAASVLLFAALAVYMLALAIRSVAGLVW